MARPVPPSPSAYRNGGRNRSGHAILQQGRRKHCRIGQAIILFTHSACKHYGATILIIPLLIHMHNRVDTQITTKEMGHVHHPCVYTSLAHPGLFYTGKIGLAYCHTLSCVALQLTVQPNQIAERLVRHLTPYVNQSVCRHRPAHVISARKLRYGYGIVFCY